MELNTIITGQLALDYSCTTEEINSSENIFKVKSYMNGRRVYSSDGCFLKVLCINGKLVFSSDIKIYDELVARYQTVGSAWFSEFSNLLWLDNLLRRYNHRIADLHHYYIPSAKFVEPKPLDGIDLKWFEKEQLEAFRGDSRFDEALAFSAQRPDMLAVTASIGGQIAAMAAASADAARMWQIGVNTLPGYTGRGLGSYLTLLLKNEILHRGIVPFYGTVESHIQSQKVAVSAGFTPAWAELYSEEV